MRFTIGCTRRPLQLAHVFVWQSSTHYLSHLSFPLLWRCRNRIRWRRLLPIFARPHPQRQHLEAVPSEGAAQVLADHDHIRGELVLLEALLAPPHDPVRECSHSLFDRNAKPPVTARREFQRLRAGRGRRDWSSRVAAAPPKRLLIEQIRAGMLESKTLVAS